MDVDVAAAARLLSDTTRAAVVETLLDGRAMTAGELARAAGVSAPTASTHLRRMVDGGLVTVHAQGRHRYYRLVDERVGRAYEALAALAPPRPVRSLRQSRVSTQLRLARTCYDHLAGAVAVRLESSLTAGGVLVDGPDGYQLGDHGEQRLSRFGLDVPALQSSRRPFALHCLDWSERRWHVAGALGAALLGRMVELDWLGRRPGSRAVRLNDRGREGLQEAFGCDLEALST